MFDDKVNAYRKRLLLGGVQKSRFLAWRSWQNAQGQRAVDDSAPISIDSDEGDICPSPIPLQL